MFVTFSRFSALSSSIKFGRGVAYPELTHTLLYQQAILFISAKHKPKLRRVI